MFSKNIVITTLFFSFILGGSMCNAQLSPFFYSATCPQVYTIIRDIINDTLFTTDPRIAASLIRLHFHDCFVQGCDGSLLLDNSSTIVSEKDAAANRNSARGFEVVDAMKAAIEAECPGVVSCADILTIAAVESTFLSGGPWWPSFLGRRDSLTANFTIADTQMPSPFDSLEILKRKFADRGLNETDLVSLSGAHTFGRAVCATFRGRLYNFNNTGNPDPTLDPVYRDQLRQICPQNTPPTNITNLDPVTPDVFDSAYFTNLQDNRGLLTSDQVLFSTPGATTIDIVNRFADQTAFFEAFIESMIKMGNINPLTGTQGEIRANCRVVNGASIQSNKGLLPRKGLVSSM